MNQILENVKLEFKKKKSEMSVDVGSLEADLSGLENVSKTKINGI